MHASAALELPLVAGAPVMSTTPLSVCCLTADDPAMVAAALGVLRDVAGEILVAVDSRVDPRA